MRNIEIVRGFRNGGLEAVYDTDPTVEVVDGDIIDPTGKKVTLTDAKKVCGIATQPSNLGATDYREGSRKTPVFVSNFTVRTKKYQPAVYAVNDLISVKDGLPTKVDATNTIEWGIVTAVNEDSSIDIQVTA